MDEQSAKMRNQVKKCFKTMRVERISREFFLSNGHDVFVKVAENYAVKMAPPSGRSLMLVCSMPVRMITGGGDIESEKLVAFSLNYASKECCEYRTMKAIPVFQKKYAYYGLIYERNRCYLEELKLKYVNDGVRSITEHSNTQPFLIDRFNFRNAYCHIKSHYRWWYGLGVKLSYPFRKWITNREL